MICRVINEGPTPRYALEGSQTHVESGRPQWSWTLYHKHGVAPGSGYFKVGNGAVGRIGAVSRPERWHRAAALSFLALKSKV